MEETELIKVGFQGTEMFLRVTKDSVKEALKLIKFLITLVPRWKEWDDRRSVEKMKKKMTNAEYELLKNRQKVKAGQMDYENFIKTYGAEERTIINVTDDSADRFCELANKHKLTYTLIPDFNLADGVFQIMVPAEQADIYKVIIEKLTKEELKRTEEKITSLEAEIKKMKKEKAGYQKTMDDLAEEGKEDTEEYRQAEEEFKKCDDIIKEKEAEIADLRNVHTGEITWEDYMATNPFAFNHQEIYSEMMEKGVELKAQGLAESILSVAKETKTVVNTMDFEKSLTNVTGRKELLDSDRQMVLCDVSNPENHIVASTFTKEHDDKPYICTKYDVYADGVKQKCDEFSHGEFTHYSDLNAKNSSETGNEHWENIKREMKEKGKITGEVVTFDSMKEYENFMEERKNGKSLYIANPNTIDIAVKMDLQEKGTWKCTIINKEAETKTSYEVLPNMNEGDVLPFIRIVNKEIRNKSGETEDEWVTLNNESQYKEFLKSVKSNTPSEKEAEKEVSDKVPEMKESLEREGIKHAEKTKQILDIPRDNLLIIQDNKQGENTYTLFSGDMKYRAELPKDRVKAGADDRLLLVLESDEAVEFVEHKTGITAGQINNEESLNGFLNEEISKGKENINHNREEDLKIKAGDRNAATI